MQRTGWKDFVKFVEGQGGFLSNKLRQEVHLLWNGIGDAAWPLYHAQGIEPAGENGDGAVWRFKEKSDFRERLLENLL